MIEDKYLKRINRDDLTDEEAQTILDYAMNNSRSNEKMIARKRQANKEKLINKIIGKIAFLSLCGVLAFGANKILTVDPGTTIETEDKGLFDSISSFLDEKLPNGKYNMINLSDRIGGLVDIKIENGYKVDDNRSILRKCTKHKISNGKEIVYYDFDKMANLIYSLPEELWEYTVAATLFEMEEYKTINNVVVNYDGIIERNSDCLIIALAKNAPDEVTKSKFNYKLYDPFNKVPDSANFIEASGYKTSEEFINRNKAESTTIVTILDSMDERKGQSKHGN